MTQSAGPCPHSSSGWWMPCFGSLPWAPAFPVSSSGRAGPCRLAHLSACSPATSSLGRPRGATSSSPCRPLRLAGARCTSASTLRPRSLGSPHRLTPASTLTPAACVGGNLVAEWRALDHRPSLSVLVAVVLHEQSTLSWNFDLHCVGDGYTLGDDDGQDWCAAGGGVRECDCATPLPCPRDRFLRTPGEDEDSDAAEEEDWTIATDGWPRR